jgi:WASH complex subunit FAM21
MNEAVIMGMSIMDTYFERLDPNQAKSANSDQDDDDEDDILAANTSSNVDLFIYETKDPYVLRSLPYLIGSQAFLDNDHVGLKDLDSEDEEIDAGDEENGEDIGTVPDEDEDDDHYSDEDKSRTTNAPETKITKIENYDDSSSTSSSSGELFVKSKPSKINEKRKVYSFYNYFVVVLALVQNSCKMKELELVNNFSNFHQPVGFVGFQQLYNI